MFNLDHYNRELNIGVNSADIKNMHIIIIVYHFPSSCSAQGKGHYERK